jgi:hypothetical protein
MPGKAVISLTTGLEDPEKATGVACEGCPPLAELFKRYEAARRLALAIGGP